MSSYTLNSGYFEYLLSISYIFTESRLFIKNSCIYKQSNHDVPARCTNSFSHNDAKIFLRMASPILSLHILTYQLLSIEVKRSPAIAKVKGVALSLLPPAAWLVAVKSHRDHVDFITKWPLIT